MSREVFETFDKLTAVKANAVSDQTVMTFASAAARATAIPSPTTGMVTARDDNNGAPEYYNGSTWVAVSAGVAVPSVWALGNAENVNSTRVALSTSANTWAELSADLGEDAIIFGVGFNIAVSAGFLVELGTGAAAAEVTRFASWSRGAGWIQLVVPYGVAVPDGTRVAIRTSSALTGLNPVIYWVSGSGTLVESGRTAGPAMNTNTTAWVEVAANPPKAGGVEIVGLSFRTSPPSGVGELQLGFGAAASEVQAIGVDASGLAASQSLWIPPLTWPPGTRLAARFESTSGSTTPNLDVVWRASLDV